MSDIPETIYSRARTALAYAQTAASSGEPEKAIEIIAREMMAQPASDPLPSGLSEWSGWDSTRSFWSAVKHQDDVCGAVFRAPWSMEDAAALISFIDRTWGGK